MGFVHFDLPVHCRLTLTTCVGSGRYRITLTVGGRALLSFFTSAAIGWRIIRNRTLGRRPGLTQW